MNVDFHARLYPTGFGKSGRGEKWWVSVQVGCSKVTVAAQKEPGLLPVALWKCKMDYKLLLFPSRLYLSKIYVPYEDSAKSLAEKLLLFLIFILTLYSASLATNITKETPTDYLEPTINKLEQNLNSHDTLILVKMIY